MSTSPDRVSRFGLLKARIDRLVERLQRTTFRDRLERQLLMDELERALARLPSAAKARSRAVVHDPELLRDSQEASDAVQSAFRALAAPEPTDAWMPRVAQLESGLSLLLAAEEDLLGAA